jgi:hypothetical protein
VEALQFLLDDPTTEGQPNPLLCFYLSLLLVLVSSFVFAGIVLIGEVGGPMEFEVVEYLESLGPKRPRKPIVGFIAGVAAYVFIPSSHTILAGR